MFTPGRYVIIDDQEAELRALVDALHQIGAPGLGILYDSKKGVRPELLGGVRLLFLDLHLLEGVQVGQQAQAYDVIVEILEQGIDPTRGPYVIILWTSHAARREEFEQHIMSPRLSPGKRPLAVLALDKTKYLPNPTAEQAEQLRQDVTDAIAADPRLHALLVWERDVLAAAGATLSALGDLIPADDRTSERYGKKLDVILSVLAEAAVGKKHAKSDIRSAVNLALAPILLDRILNQSPRPEAAEVWTKAVTRIGKDALEESEAARINTMLHAALPPAENVRPFDWGAVVLVPEAELSDAAVKRFALTKNELLAKCPSAEAGLARCRLALIRIGPGCDYAQSRKGPIPYVLASILPSDIGLKEEKDWAKGWIGTPVLDLPDFGRVFLYADARYQVSLVEEDVKDWPVLCRLREQLLMQIAAHCAEYSTRPGIVAVHPPRPKPASFCAPAASAAPQVQASAATPADEAPGKP